MSTYQPPFTITPAILNQVAAISEIIGRLTVLNDPASTLRLRRANRIRTVHGSLAIEGNALSEAQVSAVLEGKRVIAPARDLLEVKNALTAYDRIGTWNPHAELDLLDAHRVLMAGLLDEHGRYRRGGVGVMVGDRLMHMAPPADRVPTLMTELLTWLGTTDAHPLVASTVFHYEFEFIHPFTDGNGRMGRLWQTVVLHRWHPLFADLPVESLVHQHQPEYYLALEESNHQADSAPFLTFMLRMIVDALAAVAPQVTHQVTPQVGALLAALRGAMTRQELQTALSLADRTSFRERYLKPALDDSLIEMTIADKPNSRLQRYRMTQRGRQWLAEHGPVRR